MTVRAHGRGGSLAGLLAALLVAAGLVVADSGAATAVDMRTISGHIELPTGADSAYYANLQVSVSGDTTYASGYDDVIGADGNFSIGSLPSDTYVLEVSVSDSLVGSEYVPIPLAAQFYPASFVRATAGHIDATSGDSTGLTMTLTSAGKISGHVTVAPEFNQDWINVVVVTVRGVNGAVKTAAPSPNTGDFTIANLPIGDYTVKFEAPSYSDGDGEHIVTLLTQYFNDVLYEPDAQLVPVQANTNTSGIGAVMSNDWHFTTAPNPIITYTSLASGASLGIDTGTWSPSAELDYYEWSRNGEVVAWSTNTYVLTPADRGASITVSVSGRYNYGPWVQRTSEPLPIPLLFTKTVTPTITGTAKAGSTLTAHRGTWSPATTSNVYQWKRDGGAIGGATGSTYQVKTADRGHDITVTVTGKRSGYLPTPKTSARLHIAKVFTKTVTPTITGTARAGHTLTAHRGTWSPTPTYSYRWYRNGSAISGATHSTYKLTSSDKGKKITVKVTGKRAGYATTVKTSAAKAIAR